MTPARQWEVEEFHSYLRRTQVLAGKMPRKNKRVDKFVECLSDGYANGLRGPALYKFARNESCGLSPLAWLQLLSLLWSIYTHFIEWKRKRQTISTKGFE